MQASDSQQGLDDPSCKNPEPPFSSTCCNPSQPIFAVSAGPEKFGKDQLFLEQLLDLEAGPALRRIHHADIDKPFHQSLHQFGSSALSARIEISGCSACISGSQRSSANRRLADMQPFRRGDEVACGDYVRNVRASSVSIAGRSSHRRSRYQMPLLRGCQNYASRRGLTMAIA
jgi:hypothetical protein